MILLEELGLELPHRFERSVSLGDRFQVQVSRSDPHRDGYPFSRVIGFCLLPSKLICQAKKESLISVLVIRCEFLVIPRFLNCDAPSEVICWCP
ncbi:MAG UNVERIFIED_CONTAM: hypothetical protein LVR29_32030 [Microcystis novacekii LVE1205-3]